MGFWADKKVLVTGGGGFVGTHVVKKLEETGCRALYTPSRSDCDLIVESEVADLFSQLSPDVVIHLAGKVGGILANKCQPGTFFYENIMAGTLVLEYARRQNTQKLVALAAGCGYPLGLDVPYKESDFWKGLPQPESMGYSMGKKMLVIQSLAYREQYGFNSSILLPSNLYGPHDNFNLENCHVVPALIRKFLEAKEKRLPSVTVWGSGHATREFLYAEDAAQAILSVAERFDETGPLNLGTGVETSIKELITMLCELISYEGEIIWDAQRPEGQSRRLYCMKEFESHLGYIPPTPLREGLRKTIDWYSSSPDKKRL